MSEIVPYSSDNVSSSYHRCQPLVPEWVFGFNPRIPLLNLTTQKGTKEFVMATGNLVVFCKTEKQSEVVHTLIGHKNPINMIVAEGSGRFVVSSDSVHCVNVWDREADPGKAPMAIRTIYEPFKTSEISAIGLSHDGKYLLIASTRFLLQLWQWTVGNDAPDDTLELPNRLGKIRNIRFSADPTKLNHFIITFESGIAFGYYDHKNEKLSIEVPKKHSFQEYTDSVFVEETPRAVSVTGAGMAIVWSDDKKAEAPNRKQFLKYLHLKYASINVIKYCDQKLITGDDDGEIRFYDTHMRILYWFKQEEPEPVRTISFNIQPRKFVLEATPENHDPDVEVINLESLPRDVSLAAQPVIVRNFLMATKAGHIHEVDIVQNKIQELFYPSGSIITAFDVHPDSTRFCACDGNGSLTVYNLTTKNAISTLKIPIERTRRGRISALRYSPCGSVLLGGAENGFIWIINPDTMLIQDGSPLEFGTEKIHLLVFAPDSKRCIFTDTEGSVGVLERDSDSWKLTGKCISHNVVDMLFIDWSAFLTIGNDRHLIEYHLDTAETNILLSTDSLCVRARVKIEQSAHTTAFLRISERRLLIANDQFKFKIFNLDTFAIMHTFLAPYLNGPIRSLNLLPGEEFISFMTDNNVYIHQLPIDGNPYKCMGVFAHPKKLHGIRLVEDRYVLCYGEGDHAVSKWKINTTPLIENLKYCGTGLDPYCSLLPGGKTGCYVKEMLSLFFYNQISPKHSEEETELTIRDAMDIRDVPNFMRSIGFHMSQFEEDNLMKEIHLFGVNFLTFEEVAKLFLNHRTLFNPDCEDVRAALMFITKGVFSSVDLKSFNRHLSKLGEKPDVKLLDYYAAVLFPKYILRQSHESVTDEGETYTFLVPLEALADKLV
ncbi:cilia- and flagella-associated protein 251-like isoform X2 [Uranotaenia lowii]|uniref:cilia- and flagella-associated protein 251-like isoform X2 n=1 Tax=Uranotaenia lowii TaxID=190385 RepID=UPI0024794869|nr:cilia- and flagella-associated protein 251-like isoform X2 [Uranotaenia lowii]